MSGRRYLLLLFGYTFLLVGSMVPINYLVDPFGIYLYQTANDWPHARPGIIDQTYPHKEHLLRRLQPDTLLMGSSRSAWGLDPLDPLLGGHAYNGALAGGRAYENWRYFQDAVAAHVPKLLILGIDSTFFVPDQPNIQFAEGRMRMRDDGTEKPFYAYGFADTIPTLVSLSTFRASIQSLRAPLPDKFDFTAGFSGKDAGFWDGWKHAENVLETNRKIDLEWLDEEDSYRGADGKTPQMDAYEKIISLCVRNHIRLIVFVHPTHVATLDRLTTHWDSYCDWMITVVNKTTSASGGQAEFWDFAGYNSISTEPFPLPTDKFSHMQYYWDRCHYRKNVGAAVLQRLLTAGGVPNFGRRVTPGTVDQDLNRLRREKAAWHDQGQAVRIEGIPGMESPVR